MRLREDGDLDREAHVKGLRACAETGLARRVFVLPMIALVAIGCGSSTSIPDDAGVPADDSGVEPDGSTPPTDSPPALEVETPPRASWVTDVSVMIAGTATDDQPGLGLTINGAPASTDASGVFSVSVPSGFGLLVLDTVATDSVGNAATDTRSVLAGTFLPYGDAAADGIEVQLNEGAGGIAELEALGATLIDAQELGALIPSPAYQNSSQSCLGVCVTWYSVTLNVTNPRFGGAQLVIDPQANGQIRLQMTISDPRLDWSASGVVVGISGSGNGEIRAASITVEIVVEPMIDPSGKITLSPVSATAAANNFVWDMSGFLYDVLSFFGADAAISNLIRDAMVNAINDAVQTEVPALLENALNDLALSYAFPISNRTYTLNATPSTIDVVDTGITLGLATEVTADQTVHTGELGLGSLQAGYTPPVWGTEPGAGVALSGDFLNQLLLALWRGGLLDIETTPEAAGIPYALVQSLAPGATAPLIATHAGLPPVLVPGEGGHAYELQVGDLRVTLYDGPAADGNEVLQAWVSAKANLDLDVATDGKLNVIISDSQLAVDVTLLSDPNADATQTEALFETLLPPVLGGLGSAFGGVALPSISGFSIQNTAVRTGGGDNGYLVIEGELTGP